MAKVLYGDPIDYIQMGADLRIEPMLARQIVEAHGSRGDLPRASLGRDMLTSLG